MFLSAKPSSPWPVAPCPPRNERLSPAAVHWLADAPTLAPPLAPGAPVDCEAVAVAAADDVAVVAVADWLWVPAGAVGVWPVVAAAGREPCVLVVPAAPAATGERHGRERHAGADESDAHRQHVRAPFGQILPLPGCDRRR